MTYVIYEQKLQKDTKTLLEFSRTRKRKIKENGSKKMRDSRTPEKKIWWTNFTLRPKELLQIIRSWASLSWKMRDEEMLGESFYQSITTRNLHVIQNTSSTMPFNLSEHPQHTREVSNFFEDFFSRHWWNRKKNVQFKEWKFHQKIFFLHSLH